MAATAGTALDGALRAAGAGGGAAAPGAPAATAVLRIELTERRGTRSSAPGSGPTGVEHVYDVHCGQGRKLGAVEVQNRGCTAIAIESDIYGDWVQVLPWTPLTTLGLWADTARDGEGEEDEPWEVAESEVYGSHRFPLDVLMRGGFQRDALLHMRVIVRAARILGMEPSAQRILLRLVERRLPVS